MKWVHVDLGRRVNIDSVALLPCYDSYDAIGGGFGFPMRFKIEAGDDPEFQSGVAMFWTRHHETFMGDFPDPGLRPFIAKSGMGGIDGRYVRVTAVKLAPRKNDFIFALAEVQVFDEGGTNVALGRPVAVLDSIESPPRWRKTNLTDGIAPEPPSLEDRKKLIQERDALVLSVADETTRVKLADARRQLNKADAGLRGLPAPSLVYVGAVHTGKGNFRGTGADGGKPRAIHILHRGDVKEPGPGVGPGAHTAVAGLPARFNLPPTHAEGERRAALAQWLTSPQQPLTWRSIVNRVWQYHFGRGLVETANAFGRNGARPTHPELLDWLASEFRDGGGSLKQLHKLIVTSATYRQASANRVEGEKADADNLFLWRMNRRKLDAEALRDSVLFVSGQLNTTMGGRAFRTSSSSSPATHRITNINSTTPATRVRAVAPFTASSSARIRSYELAARMQLAAPETLDISKEPDYIVDQYGIDRVTKEWPKEINAREEMDGFGRKCLAARRLLERGVRFVQIWSGKDNTFPRRNWDSHEDLERDHGPMALGMARGAAALILDLKQRGLLDDTIILWTSEFGRMPPTQGGKGRDHNPYVFTNWLCGGGIKGGITYGESDQWGYKPLDRSNSTEVYDIHATILRLLGIEHRKLTFHHDGADRRLTDVHGHVISELLA